MPALSPQRWAELSHHLDELLTLPPLQRARRLDALAANDEVTAADLRAMLADFEHTGSNGFLDAGPAAELLGGAGHTPAAGDALGPWALVAPLGEGGMGSVWRARRSDGRFDGVAAIKLLKAGLRDATSSERFKREGAVLARLHHGGIATLLDAGIGPQGQPYLVLELVEGVPIDQWCSERRLPLRERVALFVQVLDAVGAAHAQLVLHRDLKPSNMLVDGGGRVKLLDFGIARLLGDEAATATLTRDGQLALTPRYAAPEQARGLPLATATDVYQLGVVLYELLAAQHPSGLQPGASLVEYLRAAVEPQAVPPSQRCSDTATARALRGDLDTIVMKALRAEPAERYPSVAALADDLQRWLGLRPIAARRESRAYVLRRWAQRNRALAAVGSLGVLALAFGAVGTATQAGRAEREAAQALAQGRAAQAAAAESERQRVLAEQRRGEAEAQRSEAQAQRRDALSARETAQLEAQRAADASTVAARERRRADERAAEAEAQRDAALRELDRADAASQFVVYLLGGFGNKSYTTAELLKTAQQMIERQYADDAKQRAQLLLLVSTLYGSAQQPNASLPLLEQAAAAARTANDAALSAGITCLEGTMHHQLGNNGRAEAVLGQGIDRARGAGSRADSTLAGCFAARAQARAASGNVAGAEDDAKAGLALLKAPRSGDRLVQLNLNGTLARVYAVQARYGDSIAAQRRTVEGWRAIGRLDTPEGVSVRSNLAAALNNGGLTREALDILLELQAMADPAGQPRGPVSMINMGTMYSVIGFNDEAVAWAERGTQAAQAQGSPMGLAQAAGRAATVMCRAGRYARCAELVAMARGPLDTLPAQDPGRSLTAFAESQLALQAGRHDEALAALEPSIAFDEATQRFKVSLASGCVAAARIERARGRHAQAHAWLDRAQQAAAAVEATVPHTVHMGNVHLERARLLAAEWRTADSARAATAALRHFEVGAGSDAPVTLEARQLAAAR